MEAKVKLLATVNKKSLSLDLGGVSKYVIDQFVKLSLFRTLAFDSAWKVFFGTKG